MSNALTFARQSLADLLTDANFRTSSEVPQTFSPPLSWVAPRAPYRRPGQTFSRKRIALSVICLAAPGTNQTVLEAVDDMTSGIADVIDASDGFRLDPDEEIGVPEYYTSAQGQEFLGAAVNVYVEVDR